MIGTVRRCGQQAIYRYDPEFQLQLKVQNVGLLRGRVVHRVQQIELTNPGMVPTNTICDKVVASYAGDEQHRSTEEKLREKYSFPHENNKRAYFSWKDFMKQIYVASQILEKYVHQQKLTPLLIGGVLQVENPLIYPVDDITCKNIIDLIAVDGNGEIGIYDWKIGMKKYSVSKDGLSDADMNTAVVSYAIAACHTYPDYFSPPVMVRLVHTVVSKLGKPSESTDIKKFGQEGLEVFERLITQEEMDEEREAIIQDIIDIRGGRLRKRKEQSCTTMCDFARICLKGDDKPYERRVYGTEGQGKA